MKNLYLATTDDNSTHLLIVADSFSSALDVATDSVAFGQSIGEVDFICVVGGNYDSNQVIKVIK